MAKDQSEEWVMAGKIPLEVIQAVNQMKAREASLLQEIGRLELQKADLLAEVRRIEKISQNLLGAEADRLGIPKGSPWKLDPGGEATYLRGEGS
jgi:hypothetical protein